MRVVCGAVLVAFAVAAAQPAFAGEGAAPAPVALASLPVVSTAITADVATGLAGTLADKVTSGLAGSLTGGLTAATPILADMRLPTVTLTAAAPIAPGDDAAMLRRRFSGNSMFEFYPAAGSGFHLSGGTRLYSRRNFLKETEDSARGALAVTRSITAPMVTRPGFRRFNPALTAGYTLAVSTAMRIGIEGGAMMGHLFASAPGLPRNAFGYRSDTAVRANPVANLVFGWHF